MAYDKVVDSSVLDAGLKQIANAIREKGGTSDNLAFPTAMADAIAAIEAGGGNTLNGKKIMTGTITTENSVAEIIIPISREEMESVFGYAVSGADYKHIAGYYDEGAKNGLVNGALHGLSFLGISGSPHYYNGSSVTRGSATAALIQISSTGGIRIRGYNSTYGFIPGRIYRWFIMEA